MAPPPLFAALNAANGEVYSFCQERHRHQEWLKFLRLLHQAMPSHLDLHLIGDNYATHKHPKVQRWLARHPRFHTHFTPTSASWLNMVERFFGDLTQNRPRRGIFRDLEELFWQSAVTSTATTNIPNPSSGRPALPTSGRRSNAPAARCINVTLHDALH
jgi:hypothetical protein